MSLMALGPMLMNGRRDMRGKTTRMRGNARAATFTWARSAAAHVAAYTDAIGSQ